MLFQECDVSMTNSFLWNCLILICVKQSPKQHRGRLKIDEWATLIENWATLIENIFNFFFSFFICLFIYSFIHLYVYLFSYLFTYSLIYFIIT